MTIRTACLLLAAAAVAAWTAGRAFTEDEKPAEPMSEMAIWQKMQAWAQPSEHHELLDRLIGRWTAAGRIVSSMGEFPFGGTSENAWVLGRRFLETRYEGTVMGGTFEGRGFLGYDNGRGRFQQVWMMTMASDAALTTGVWDAEAKTLTWTGRRYMPDGHEHATREVYAFDGADRYVATSYGTGPDGKERKRMVIEYTRIKDEVK